MTRSAAFSSRRCGRGWSRSTNGLKVQRVGGTLLQFRDSLLVCSCSRSRTLGLGQSHRFRTDRLDSRRAARLLVVPKMSIIRGRVDRVMDMLRPRDARLPASIGLGCRRTGAARNTCRCSWFRAGARLCAGPWASSIYAGNCAPSPPRGIVIIALGSCMVRAERPRSQAARASASTQARALQQGGGS